MWRAAVLVPDRPVKAEPFKVREISEKLKELAVVYTGWRLDETDVERTETGGKNVSDAGENVGEAIRK